MHMKKSAEQEQDPRDAAAAMIQESRRLCMQTHDRIRRLQVQFERSRRIHNLELFIPVYRYRPSTFGD